MTFQEIADLHDESINTIASRYRYAGTIFNYLTGNLMGVSRLCALRANIAALDGNADAAIASVYSDVKLSRATSLVPSFAALAFVLKRTHPSRAALTKLADALAELDRDDAMQQQLIRLRAQMLDEGYAAGGLPHGGRRLAGPVKAARERPHDARVDASCQRTTDRRGPLRAAPRRGGSGRLSVLTCAFLLITGGGPSSISSPPSRSTPSCSAQRRSSRA
jgi:hypothetical protein